MSAFQKGFDTFASLHGVNVGAEQGADYVSNIGAEIMKFTADMADLKQRKQNVDIDCLKGFLAEEWHDHTFNLDAALKGKAIRANAIKPGEPSNNTPIDIELSDGSKAQLKYYKTAKDSAREQADPRYAGMQRIIPADQLKEAEGIISKLVKVELAKDPNSERARAYQDVQNMLTDRLKSGGAESKPLDEAEAKRIAKILKENGFDPDDHGFTTESLISAEYIMSQAFKAGMSAALVSVVLRVAPEICGMICKLIKDGEIDGDEFKRIGLAAARGSSEGYIRGTIAAAITITCKAGHLGVALKTANPTVIGAVVAMTMNTVQNGCLMAFGRMSKHEFAGHCAQDLFVTAASLGLGVAGAAAASAMFTPAAAVFGYMIGSFVGSVIGSFVYSGVYACIVAFCIDSGSTFFGLVKQDYELPNDVLKTIGVHVFEYEKFEPIKFALQKFEPKFFEHKKFEPMKINITFLRRGVISVGTVGYANT